MLVVRWAIPSTLLGLLAGCTATPPSSGQTGSPNKEDPPTWDTPHPPPPEGGGGVTGGEGGPPGGGQLLPLPKPREQSLLLDDVLLVGGVGLNVFDASSPDALPLLGRHVEDLGVGWLQGESLARVALVASGRMKLSEPAVPDTVTPYFASRLIEVDVSAPESIELRAEMQLPDGTGDVVMTPVGYTLVGGRYAGMDEQQCGGGLLGGIEQYRPYADELWLERIERDGSGFASVDAREFGRGYWELTRDRSLAVHVPALTESEVDPVLEVVALDTLETVVTLSVPRAEISQDAYAISVDVRDGLLLASGAERVFLYDLASGERLGTVSTPAPVMGLFFEGSDLAVPVGADGLIAVTRGDAPGLDFVPATGRTSGVPAGALRRFGDGFIEVTATNQGASTLVAVLYDSPADGTLAAVSELTTTFPHYADLAFDPRWAVDSDGAWLAHTYETYDESLGVDRAKVGVVAIGNGALVASDGTELAGRYGAPLAVDGRVAYASQQGFEVFGVETSSGAVNLLPQGATRFGLLDVSFEVEHAGLWFARHRNSYGRTDVSVRASKTGEASFLELPHRTDALVPIDDDHLAVLGLSSWSECEEQEISECLVGGAGPYQPNGLSVVAISGSNAEVVASIELRPEPEDPPPAGVEQRVDWGGFFSRTEEEWLLFANVRLECSSFESCEAIGVEPIVDGGGASTPGSPAGCAGEGCPEPPPPPPEPTGPWVRGYQSRTWLVPLNFGDPSAPVLGSPIEGGLSSDLSEEEHRRSAGPRLLHESNASGEVFGYANEESLYGPDGNSLLNEHGHAMSRNWLQLFSNDGEWRFHEPINVPGRVVLLGPSEWSGSDDAEYAGFSLAPAYDTAGAPYQRLLRLAITPDGAMLDEELELPGLVWDAMAQGTRVVLLQGPEDFCSPEAIYELRVVDPSRTELALSAPLVLEPGTWGFNPYAPPSLDPDLVHVMGGPAVQARAVVDVTRDPPELVRYESFDW